MGTGTASDRQLHLMQHSLIIRCFSQQPSKSRDDGRGKVRGGYHPKYPIGSYALFFRSPSFSNSTFLSCTLFAQNFVLPIVHFVDLLPIYLIPFSRSYSSSHPLVFFLFFLPIYLLPILLLSILLLFLLLFVSILLQRLFLRLFLRFHFSFLPLYSSSLSVSFSSVPLACYPTLPCPSSIPLIFLQFTHLSFPFPSATFSSSPFPSSCAPSLPSGMLFLLKAPSVGTAFANPISSSP